MGLYTLSLYTYAYTGMDTEQHRKAKKIINMNKYCSVTYIEESCRVETRVSKCVNPK